MNAVGFSFLCCKATLNVNFARHRFQVLWANALPDATQVIDVQPLRWLALKMTVAPPVRIYFLSLVLECTVSAWVKRTGPLPAAVILVDYNVVHESCKVCHRGEYSTWTNPEGQR